MNEFFKNWKFKILIAIIALLFGAMLFSASRDGVAQIPSNLFAMITQPFQSGLTFITNASTEFFEKYLNSAKNYEENEQLKKQIGELRAQLTDYEEMKNENEQLKEIAGMKEHNPDIDYMPANVVSRDSSNMFYSFVIDKGSLDGVKLNDPVVSSDGLIGIVTAISSINARVTTILSPELNIGVFETETKEPAVVNGEISLMQDGLCQMTILSNKTEMKEGGLVVTSGSGGIFPKSLTVGTINSISLSSQGASMNAVISPSADIKNAKHVFVITDFEGKGSILEGFNHSSQDSSDAESGD